MSADLQPRTPISDAIKASVADAFRAVPDGKSGALLAIADENGARLHVAFKVGESWKVGAAVGRPWRGGVEGSISVVGYW
jgi:hypothetical protein